MSALFDSPLSWRDVAPTIADDGSRSRDYLPATIGRSDAGGQNSNVLQLGVQSLTHGIDWELASQSIRCLPGRVVVEMLPALTQVSMLVLPDGVGGNLRPDVGVVLASGETLDFGVWSLELPKPGTLVCVRPYDGTWFAGADCGDYEPEGQVRCYGAYKEFDRPEKARWWDSVVAGIRVSDGKIVLDPYVDKIVLKLDPIEETEGGILLEDLSKYRNGLATVLAVGELVDGLAPGDRVCYDVEMLLQTGLGLDLTDDRDHAVCTDVAICYVIEGAEMAAADDCGPLLTIADDGSEDAA